jgi:hypothetical protein
VKLTRTSLFSHINSTDLFSLYIMMCIIFSNNCAFVAKYWTRLPSDLHNNRGRITITESLLLKLTLYLSETIKCMCVAKQVRTGFSAQFSLRKNQILIFVTNHSNISTCKNLITDHRKHSKTYTCTFNHLFNYTFKWLFFVR